MKMLSVQVEDKMATEIDRVIKETGFFSSRSEFLKDSIRSNIAKIQERAVYRKKVRAAFRRLAQKAKAAGWNGELPTREERVKIADEYMKEKGWTYD